MDSAARRPRLSNSEKTNVSRGILGAVFGPGDGGPNDKRRGYAETVIRRSAVGVASDSRARSGSPAGTHRDRAGSSECWHSRIGRCFRSTGVAQGVRVGGPSAGRGCLPRPAWCRRADCERGYLLLGGSLRSIRAGAIEPRRIGDGGRNRACGDLGQEVERVSEAVSTRSGVIDSRSAHRRTPRMTGGHCRVVGVFPLARGVR